MSGRPRSTRLGDTMSTWWCRLGWRTLPRSSKPSLMTSSVMSLTTTSSFTWTTSWYFRRHWRNTSPTSASSSSGFWRTASTQRQRSASSTAPRSSSSTSWCPGGRSPWTPLRPRQWCRGLPPPTASPIFIGGSSGDSVPVSGHWQHWHPPRSRSAGHLKPTPPSQPSKRASPPPQSSSCPTRRSSSFWLPPETQTPETILPAWTLVAVTRLEIEDQVERSLGNETPPEDTPANRMYVPEDAHPEVLQWAHSSSLACHPGVRCTLALLSRRFWWPSARLDLEEFVAACLICARAKGNSQHPQGLLQPLPVPHRPWSHIAVDFVTGLPESQGSSVILTIVDRFSKSAHFVALPKLPSTKETAQLLVQNVFRLHGLPLEVTSDRGPQFTSAFWKAFCMLVGVRPQLSSGFHPQTNGQTERLNQELEKSLGCLVEGSPSSWPASLP